MMWFKSCPKCQGDLYLDRDLHGFFISCLHCGLLRDVRSEHIALCRAKGFKALLEAVFADLVPQAREAMHIA